MSTTKEPAALWHNRNYLLLWSGQIVSSIGGLVVLATATTKNRHLRSASIRS